MQLSLVNMLKSVNWSVIRFKILRKDSFGYLGMKTLFTFITIAHRNLFKNDLVSQPLEVVICFKECYHIATSEIKYMGEDESRSH